MKRFSTILMVLLLALMSFAGNVSEQQALQRAQAFLKANNRDGVAVMAKAAAHKAPRKAQTAADAYYYVFNLDGNQGFVIVSGDDRTEPILGYADNGAFDANNIPSNVKYFLDGYVEEMKWMEDNGYTLVGEPWQAPTTAVAPLVTSQWNQGAPYNNLCPLSNGSRCVTGCVATAMAQIMYYHKWPTGTVSKINGYTQSNGITVDALEATTFDWSNMTDTYNNYSSATSRTAVATLMAFCGSSVKMNYSTSGSGAYSSNVPSALINNFGYASSAKYVSRTGYSIDEWDALITNELVNNRPVYYSGSTSSNEGHAFVCDGRRADGMFHINWGWGGYCDGFYRLSLLDPSGQGIGGSSTGSKFSMGQGVIVGISKTNVSMQTTDALAVGRQSVKNSLEYTRTSTSSNFTGITVALPVYCTQGASAYSPGTMGLGLFKDGTFSKLITSFNPYYIYNPSSYSVTPRELTIQLGSDLADGEYDIVPVISSSGQWNKINQADKNYIKATINGKNLTLKIYPEGDFKVTNTSFTNKNLIVNFTNDGEEYNGNIYLYNAAGTVLGKETVAVPANTTDKVNIYVSDADFSLNEAFFLSTDYYLRDYFYTNLTSADADMSKTVDLLNATNDNTVIYGKTIRLKVTLTNAGTGDYRHNLITELYDAGNTTTAVATKSQLVDVPAGGTLEVEQEFTLTDAQMGKTYMIKVAHVNGSANVYLSTNSFEVGYGATAWDAGGDVISIPGSTTFVVPENVVAIDLRAVGTTNITPNSNPNTIYLLESVPTSLKGKNVVNAQGRTGTITFYDGYPYYIPETIQTKKVYYKRTFTADEAGSWTTIALPFAPNVVKNETDSKTLTWHTSEADSGKDFWIQELSSVSENYLTFTNIATFTENRPYIIAVPEALAGKTISFQKELSNIYVDLTPASITHTVGQVTLYGVCGDTDANGMFVLKNDKFMKAGSAGAKGALRAGGNATVAPFRVYAKMESGSYDELLINSSHTTAIRTIHTDEMTVDGNEVWYTINGIRLNSRPTTKGVYVVNGKKVVLK